MSDIIYIRERGHKYNYENGYSRPDGFGGRTVKQGLMIEFKPISDINQTGIFNATKAVDKYIMGEIVAGNINRGDSDKETERVMKQVRHFIETHDHYKKEDGTGQNLIWLAPTDEQRAQALRDQAEALRNQADEITKAQTADEAEEKLKDLKEELAPKKAPQELSKPVGVISGGATASDGGRG